MFYLELAIEIDSWRYIKYGLDFGDCFWCIFFLFYHYKTLLQDSYKPSKEYLVLFLDTLKSIILLGSEFRYFPHSKSHIDWINASMISWMYRILWDLCLTNRLETGEQTSLRGNFLAWCICWVVQGGMVECWMKLRVGKEPEGGRHVAAAALQVLSISGGSRTPPAFIDRRVCHVERHPVCWTTTPTLQPLTKNKR